MSVSEEDTFIFEPKPYMAQARSGPGAANESCLACTGVESALSNVKRGSGALYGYRIRSACACKDTPNHVILSHSFTPAPGVEQASPESSDERTRYIQLTLQLFTFPQSQMRCSAAAARPERYPTYG